MNTKNIPANTKHRHHQSMSTMESCKDTPNNAQIAEGIQIPKPPKIKSTKNLQLHKQYSSNSFQSIGSCISEEGDLPDKRFVSMNLLKSEKKKR